MIFHQMKVTHINCIPFQKQNIGYPQSTEVKCISRAPAPSRKLDEYHFIIVSLLVELFAVTAKPGASE